MGNKLWYWKFLFIIGDSANLQETSLCIKGKDHVWLGSYLFKANNASNGFQAARAWVQKKNVNWMGEYHELEVCIPTANKTI